MTIALGFARPATRDASGPGRDYGALGRELLVVVADTVRIDGAALNRTIGSNLAGTTFSIHRGAV